MNSLNKWKDTGKKIDFHVSFWVGGGIGDCAHHYKNMAYFRILRHLKKIFPNLYIILQVVGKNPGLTKLLFELDPHIDEIIIEKEDGLSFDKVYDWMQNDLMINKYKYARFYPGEFRPEEIFHRAVNRIYTMIKFPRVRTITMDDFFQQMQLDINDFEHDLAEIFLSDEEEEFGKTFLLKNSKPLVGIHWFSQDSERAFIPGNIWEEIIQEVVRRGYQVVIFGAPNEKGTGHSGVFWHKNTNSLLKAWNHVKCFENVRGLFDETIRQKIAVIKQCDYMLTIDGAMMHLAWLHAVPTFTVVPCPQKESRYFDNPHSYHWAAAAGEPFAKRMVCDKIKNVVPKTVINEMEKLKGTKGKRESKIWRDQNVIEQSV